MNAQKQNPSAEEMIKSDQSDLADVERKIDSILSLLTLEEKVAMCHAQSKFSTKGVPRLGIPEVWMSDGPHGVRGEINWDNWGYAGWTNDSITAFPALTCLASTFDPELSGAYGKSVGEEALYREKDVLLGPGVNIYRTPLNGRNFEYMGESYSELFVSTNGFVSFSGLTNANSTNSLSSDSPRPIGSRSSRSNSII